MKALRQIEYIKEVYITWSASEPMKRFYLRTDGLYTLHDELMYDTDFAGSVLAETLSVH